MKDANYSAAANFGFTWVSPKRTGPSSILGNGVRLHTCKGNASRPQLVITLYHDALKSLRWQAGDRIEIGFDIDAGLVALRRVINGGYCLSRSGGKKGNGARANCKLKITPPVDVCTFFEAPMSITLDHCIESDGLFIVPLNKAKVG